MLLAIDIGNTNTVFALFDGAVLQKSWRLQTVRARTPDEYAAFLATMALLDGLNLKDVRDVIVSSVVPEAHFAVQRFCSKHLGRDPLFINKEHVGIEIDLKRPEDVGADRLVNALAVVESYTPPAIVIDFGTATTFDVIDVGGAYAGGVIAPGVELSLGALHAAASKLLKISVVKPAHVTGKSTVEAMQSGMFWGYVGLIGGIVERLKAEMGKQSVVLATGGLAPLFAEECDFIDAVDEHLTLKGLVLIHQRIKHA